MGDMNLLLLLLRVQVKDVSLYAIKKRALVLASNFQILPDGEPQRVDLAQPLLVGQGRDVMTEPLEGVVDGLHPLPLAEVGRVALLHLLTHRLPAADATFASRVRAPAVVVVAAEADGVAAAHYRRLVYAGI